MKPIILTRAITSISDLMAPSIGRVYKIDGTMEHVCCEGGRTFFIDPETGEEKKVLDEQDDEEFTAVLNGIAELITVGIQATVAKQTTVDELEEVENG